MKITRVTSIHIIVEPEFGFAPPESWERIADRTLAEVKRHIDCEQAWIERETETVCSHCGLTWEEEETGEPVCCNAAQAEWAKRIDREIMAETDGPPEYFGPSK